MKHPAPRRESPWAFQFQAAKDGRFVLPHCAGCQRHHWPAQARCPHCGGETVWQQASGRGRIASYSVVVRAVNPELKDDAPYVIAFVELDEGVRIFTNIVGAPPDTLQVGQRVRCRFEPSLDPELWVPVFAPEE